MTMIPAIAKRKSVRKFSDRKVEKEKVDSILRAAMRAPSALNGQPWQFLVVDDPEILRKMQGFSRGAHAMPTAPMVIVVLNAPSDERKALPIPPQISYEDLGACAALLWIQAVEEGLAVSWMGTAPDSDNEAALIRILGLPEGVKPFNVMAVGYPAADADLTPTDRFDPAKIHYNKF